MNICNLRTVYKTYNIYAEVSLYPLDLAALCCRQVDILLVVIQGPMGPAGPQGPEGSRGMAVSRRTRSAKYCNLYIVDALTCTKKYHQFSFKNFYTKYL